MRRLIALATILVIAIACSPSKEKGDKSPAVDLIGQVANEVRDKPRIQMRVKIAGEVATEEETATLRSMEETIERKEIGRITTSGTEPGYLFLVVEADKNSSDAIEALRGIALEAGVLKQSSFRLMSSGS